MRIQELEQIVGADRATIRFYEKEGLIAPNRSENGYRDYTEENAAELKKICLLRQLGMSLHRIRQLQQGSIDFSEVLSEQEKILSGQIEAHKRAKAVCQAIHDDGAEYSTMDAEHYLKLMREIRIDDRVQSRSDFIENVPKEVHPWRRWLARMLDYGLLMTVVDFFIIVLLRVRPLPGDFKNSVLIILFGAVFIPTEAYMLSRWGTTPGKLAMGIRLESVNGGNLSIKEALRRSRDVYKDGMFFRIPIAEDLVNLYRYLRLTGRSFRRFVKRDDIPEPEDMPWDNETEIIYAPMTGKRGLILTTLVLFILGTGLITGFDSIKPKYRSGEITIAEFAENYNHCLSLYNENADSYDKLQSDGTKFPVPEDVFIVTMTGENFVPGEFEYETENGNLKSVIIQREYYDVFYATAINTEMMNLAFTLMLSQPDCGYGDILEFSKLMDSNAGRTEMNISYQELIEVTWSIESENCIFTSDGLYFTDDDSKPSSMKVTFKVTIP